MRHALPRDYHAGLVDHHRRFVAESCSWGIRGEDVCDPRIKFAVSVSISVSAVDSQAERAFWEEKGKGIEAWEPETEHACRTVTKVAKEQELGRRTPDLPPDS